MKTIYSLSNLYYCEIRQVEELNKGGFGAKFCFKNSQGELLYNHTNAYLYELSGILGAEEFEALPFSDLKLLQWAKDANSVYFTEYVMTKAKQFKYYGVVIDFNGDWVFIWDTAADNFEFVKKHGLAGEFWEYKSLVPHLSRPAVSSFHLTSIAFTSIDELF
jgi:hypothetical protein